VEADDGAGTTLKPPAPLIIVALLLLAVSARCGGTEDVLWEGIEDDAAPRGVGAAPGTVDDGAVFGFLAAAMAAIVRGVMPTVD
jgi:hypothetical protein